MKKLLPATSLNSAIRRIAEGHTGAASMIAMLNRKRPENVMACLRSLDTRAVYNLFEKDCGGNLEKFIKKLSC